jgi:chorismate dehydratase
MDKPIRIGAVTYLNARPLWYCLADLAPDARIVIDLPSRLAAGLAAGELDAAILPSVEHFRQPGTRIVSDACVACDGPVRSVKLYGRVPVRQIRTLALDEGSRTSAALARVLLKERFGLEPELEPLPIGASMADTSADAVLLIGDRGLLPPEGRFEFVWDLGEQWSQWTGLPFVFAAWIARPDIDLDRLDRWLTSARDQGTQRLEEIARVDAPALGLPEAECLSYLRDHLAFRLGSQERAGLEAFYGYAAKHRLAPAGVELAFHRPSA